VGDLNETICVTKMIQKIFKSFLFKSAGIYTATSSLNSAISFFMMPILTRYMIPSDYGIVAMFTVLINFVAPITGLSIHGAIQIKYYEREKIDLPVYLTNCLLILICSVVFVSILFYFLNELISDLSSFPKRWTWTVIIISTAQCIILINLCLWQAQLKAST
jgi:O-antigen/teichoic acid export membrane protein